MLHTAIVAVGIEPVLGSGTAPVTNPATQAVRYHPAPNLPAPTAHSPCQRIEHALPGCCRDASEIPAVVGRARSLQEDVCALPRSCSTSRLEPRSSCAAERAE